MAVLAAALVILAASPHTGFEYGRSGGNIRPFTIAISTTGAVTATGAAPDHLRRITKARLADLNRTALEARFTTLPVVTACPGTLPDIAAQYIRVGGRTVRVHGACLKGFNRLWTALSRATT